MAHFTLAYRFSVLVDGEPVPIEGSVTVDQAMSEAALKVALTHAVHNGYGRLWDALKPKPATEETK